MFLFRQIIAIYSIFPQTFKQRAVKVDSLEKAVAELREAETQLKSRSQAKIAELETV